MIRAAASQVLAIMGSGETSPTMVTVHKALVAGMGGQPAEALLLQTPYAFQEISRCSLVRRWGPIPGPVRQPFPWSVRPWRS